MLSVFLQKGKSCTIYPDGSKRLFDLFSGTTSARDVLDTEDLLRGVKGRKVT